MLIVRRSLDMFLRVAACFEIAVLQCACGHAYGQPAPPADAAIAEVRRAFAQCREVQKQAPAIELYQRRAGEPPVRTWQRNEPTEDEQGGRKMEVFARNGVLRSAIEEVEGRSGDWQQTVEHCFRPDGSVAFVLSVLRTFQGNVQVEDRVYFNAAGQRIRTLRQVSDLKTNKPLKPGEASFMDRKPQLYLRADELVRVLGRENVFENGKATTR
jgi:hypothetical protein